MATNEAIIRDHIRLIMEGDHAGALDAYADDAVLLVGGNVLAGKEAIGQLFASIPAGAFADPPEIEALTSHGEYSYFQFRHGGAQIGESFHIRDDKILMQSSHMVPGNPPA